MIGLSQRDERIQTVNEQEILELLSQSNVPADSLLEECRGPDRRLRNGTSRLYRAFARALLEQGYPARALDLAREGRDYLRDDPELNYLLALAARRGGNPQYAKVLLEPVLSEATDPHTKLPIELRVISKRSPRPSRTIGSGN